MSAPSTRLLYLRANAGDREALEELLTRMRPRLLAWVALHMGPALKARMEAEDIVQIILIKLADSVESFEPRGKRAFYKWLFTVGNNEIVQQKRKYGAHKRDAGPEQEVHSGLAGSATSPGSRAARQELVEQLVEVAYQLPGRYRDIIRLRRFEYLDNEEAAGELGLSRKNASVLYVRAMKRLREVLGVDHD